MPAIVGNHQWNCRSVRVLCGLVRTTRVLILGRSFLVNNDPKPAVDLKLTPAAGRMALRSAVPALRLGRTA
jgi:hypothetical protein